MIALSPEAAAHVGSLIEHYEAKGRVGAVVNLLTALERAKVRLSTKPEAGLEAPRPYPSLRQHGRRWIIEGRYWVSYRLTSPPAISRVFYVTADIPRRV